ncbi:MAG: branched-chain amino acid ABC transporter permease [Candidatus Odinarchaeota archaeon]
MQTNNSSNGSLLEKYPRLIKNWKSISLIIIASGLAIIWLILEISYSWDIFVIRFGRSVIDGLAFSMLLFLMVSGFFLIFGLCDVINFAHGAFFMLGGFIGFEIYLLIESILYPLLGTNLFIMSLIAFLGACLLSAVILALIGGGIEYFTIRRLYGQAIAQILLTVGFMFIINEFAKLVWGTPIQTYFIESSSPSKYFFLSGTINLGTGLVFDNYRIILIIIGLLIALLMFLTLKKTRIGYQIQAGIEDSEMVEALGINVKRLFTLTFMAGAALAGLAGTVLVPWLGANSGHGTNYLVFAFVIVVVGGAHYGRLEGTFFGSLIIGLSIKFCEYFFPDISSIIAFLIMAIVLVFKPGGLTGED